MLEKETIRAIGRKIAIVSGGKEEREKEGWEREREGGGELYRASKTEIEKEWAKERERERAN